MEKVLQENKINEAVNLLKCVMPHSQICTGAIIIFNTGKNKDVTVFGLYYEYRFYEFKLREFWLEKLSAFEIMKIFLNKISKDRVLIMEGNNE